MFSFFRKEKVTINSVVMPDFGWIREKDSSEVIQWANPQRDTLVSVHFLEQTPDIPTVKNIDVLRRRYREQVS